jgi:hypothetical protein
MRAIVFVLVSMVAAPALACTLAGNSPFEVDESLRAGDSTPPPKPVLSSVHVGRSRGMSCGDTCSNLGTVVISLEPLADPGEHPEVGYRVTTAPGSVDPGGLTSRADLEFMAPLTRTGTHELMFVFVTTKVPDVSTVLEIRTVDAAGNESEPLRVEVVDPDAGGCSTVHAATLALLGLALPRRRARGAE